MPPADRFLFNRQYVVGYSYLFRQPRWALELIDDQTMRMEDEELERLDNFREDLRIPDMFRSTLDDYKGVKGGGKSDRRGGARIDRLGGECLAGGESTAGQLERTLPAAVDRARARLLCFRR